MLQTTPELSAFILNSLQIKMILVKPGEYVMGSPPEEEERRDDETPHLVRITKPFYLASTQVTQEQWRLVMNSNTSLEKGAKLPVHNIRWDRAEEFCQAVTESENTRSFLGFKKRKKGFRQYRLPTEAEWEFACRAGTDYPFHFGRNISTEQANYCGTPYGSYNNVGTPRHKPVAVGKFKPNPRGFYDMHGNIADWCADYYGNYFFEKSEAAEDPVYSAAAAERVVRGGSWKSNAADLRSAARDHRNPNERQSDVSLRLAMDLLFD